MSDLINLGPKTVVRIAERVAVTEFLHKEGCGCRFWLEAGGDEPKFCPACGLEIDRIETP